MKLEQHILLFHGESADLVQAVHDLVVRSRTDILLHTLLSDAAEVIRQELDAAALYSSDGREGYAGSFEDVLDLAERNADRQCRSHVIDMALLATCQIAELLMYVCAVDLFDFPSRPHRSWYVHKVVLTWHGVG